MLDAFGISRLYRYISSYLFSAENVYKQCSVI